MKRNDQLSDARCAEPRSKVRKPRKLWGAGAIGMGVGVLGGSAYLLSGGEYIISIPRWASIVFFTGFAAGNQAANSGLGVGAAMVLGVIAVGLTYAFIAVLAGLAWIALKRPFSPQKQE